MKIPLISYPSAFFYRAKNVWKALKTKSLKSSIFNEIITNVENVTTNFFEFFSSEFYELYDLIHNLLFLTTIFN